MAGTNRPALRFPHINLSMAVENNMLNWALIFLVVALVAGVLGFGGIAGASMGIAKILFMIFLVLFAVSLVMHLVRGRKI